VPALTKIQRSVEHLDSRIDRLETTVESEGPKYDTEQAVTDVLQTAPGNVEEHGELQTRGMSIDQIADELESRGIIIEKTDIRRAVDGLVDTLGYIKKEEGDGTRPTVYWGVE